MERVYGVDFFWGTDDGMLVGVQRKQFPQDFLASIYQSDRLNQEILQMAELDARLLILEGTPCWNSNGLLMDCRGEFSIWRLRKMIWSMALVHGILTEWSRNPKETAEIVMAYHQWTTKEKHEGFGKRNSAATGVNGIRGTTEGMDWLAWVLMGFRGISKARAKAILNTCPKPLKWSDDFRLEDVPGIDKVLAGRLRETLGECLENSKAKPAKEPAKKKRQPKPDTRKMKK